MIETVTAYTAGAAGIPYDDAIRRTIGNRVPLDEIGRGAATVVVDLDAGNVAQGNTPNADADQVASHLRAIGTAQDNPHAIRANPNDITGNGVRPGAGVYA